MLDPVSSVPLYAQLKDVLRQAVESRQWAPGEAIPPERELTERYGVSRITVRQALSDLVAEGLLYRRHGSGTYVAPRKPGRIAESLSVLTGHLEELQLRGLDPVVEVLALEQQPLSGEAAEALRQPEGSPGWYLYRRVLVEDLPLMLAEVRLPAELNLPLQLDAVKRIGMARLLTEQGYPPVHGAQRIAAQCASPAEARMLEIAPGEALLRVVRVIYGVNDLPLVWFRTLYRADRYEYEVDLKRRR